MENVEVGHNPYDDIPVAYCKECLSLAIRGEDFIGVYCDKCGCADIGYTDIHTWEDMYEKKYGQKYLQTK